MCGHIPLAHVVLFADEEWRFSVIVARSVDKHLFRPRIIDCWRFSCYLLNSFFISLHNKWCHGAKFVQVHVIVLRRRAWPFCICKLPSCVDCVLWTECHDSNLKTERSTDCYTGAHKSLPRPGRKQATATKRARRLTCFLWASVTRKDLQFGTRTDPSFQRHYRFRPTSGSR